MTGKENFPEICTYPTIVSEFFFGFPLSGEPVFIISIGTPGAGKTSFLKRLRYELGYDTIGEDVVFENHRQDIFRQLWEAMHQANGATWQEAQNFCERWGFPYILDVMNPSLLPDSINNSYDGADREMRYTTTTVSGGWLIYPSQDNVGGGGTTFPDYLTCIGYGGGGLFPVAFISPAATDCVCGLSRASVVKFDLYDTFFPLEYKRPGPIFADAYFFFLDARLIQFINTNREKLSSGGLDRGSRDNPVGWDFDNERLFLNIAEQYQKLEQLPGNVPVIGVISHCDASDEQLESVVEDARTAHLFANGLLRRWNTQPRSSWGLADGSIIERGLSRPVSWYHLETQKDDAGNLIRMVADAFQRGAALKSGSGASLVSFLDGSLPGTINYREAFTQEQVDDFEMDVDEHNDCMVIRDLWRKFGSNPPF